MKKICIALFPVFFVACGGNKEMKTEEIPVADTNAVVSDTVPQLDAVTSATSKPNQVSFNGTLVSPAASHATVSLIMGGTVKTISVLPGTYVKKGALLAEIENPEFINLQQGYLESRAQVEFLEKEYKRQQTLVNEDATSGKKLELSKSEFLSMKSKFEAAAAQLSLLGISPASLLNEGIKPVLPVKAPISGYISDVKANLGTYIQPGEYICEIIDKGHILVKLMTYEKDLKDIHIGDSLQFRVNGMGKQVFGGILISVGQSVNDTNRSVEVYARVTDNNPDFRPGMYVTARIPKKDRQ